MTSVYTERGFKNRKDYLETLADEYGLDVAVVYNLAELYGASEDFDGLLATLDDLADEEFLND